MIKSVFFPLRVSQFDISMTSWRRLNAVPLRNFTRKKSLVNGVVTCVRVVIKIDAALLNSKDPKSIVYRDTCVETGKKEYSLESKRRKDEMKFILMKILRFRSRRMIK